MDAEKRSGAAERQQPRAPLTSPGVPGKQEKVEKRQDRSQTVMGSLSRLGRGAKAQICQQYPATATLPVTSQRGAAPAEITISDGVGRLSEQHYRN